MQQIQTILTKIEQTKKAQAMKNELPLLHKQSDLQDAPNAVAVNKLLIKMRDVYYGE